MKLIPEYLLELIKHFNLFSSNTTSMAKLAELIEVSQQSASQILAELDRNDFITRNSTAKGVTIKFTKKSINLFKNTYDILDEYFSEFSLEGTIRKGIGEGKYYVTQSGYNKKFIEILRMKKPYPGTLNLEIDADYFQIVKNLFTPKIINGFETENRSFGSLECYKCTINDAIPAWVICAKRTTHTKNIIEIISDQKIDKSKKVVSVKFIRKECS